MADNQASVQAEDQSPVSVQEFAKRVKEKYPEYKDVDDLTLATKVVEKYPEYKDRVQFDQQPIPPGPITETQPVVSERQTSYIPEVVASGKALVSSIPATNPELSINTPNTPKISDSYQAPKPTVIPQGTGNQFQSIDKEQFENEVGGAKIVQESKPAIQPTESQKQVPEQPIQQPVNPLGEVDQLKVDYLRKTRGDEYANQEQAKMQAGVQGMRTKLGKTVGSSLMAGINNATSWVADTPGFIYDLAGAPFRAVGLNVPTSKDFKDTPLQNISSYYKENAKAYEQKVQQANPSRGKGIIESFKNGDIEGGILNLAGGIAESAPASIAMMLSGGATAPTILGGAVVFGAGKAQEMDENSPEMDYDKRRVISALNGTLEGIFETYLGSGAVGKSLAGIIKNQGKEVAQEQAKRSLSTVFANMITKNPWMTPLGEGFEEVGTQISQNLVDKYSGYKPELDIMDGVGDWFLSGVSTGAMHGAIIGLAKSAMDTRNATPITTATIEGKQYTIKNPEDLGIKGTPIFAIDKTGKVQAFPNYKATDPVTKTQGEIDQARQVVSDQQKLMEGIDPTAQVSTDESEGDIRLINFSNGQSKIITPEGEVIANDESERDKILEAAINGEPLPQPKVTEVGEVIEPAPERKVITQTIGNTPIDIIEGEEFDEIVPTDKAPLEKAYVALEKKFKDNKRFKVVAEKVQIEEPGETKYDDPIKKTVIKSIKIVPVEVLEKQKQAETDNLLNIVEEYNATPQSLEDKQKAGEIESVAKKLGYQTERNAMNQIRLFDNSGTIERPKVSENINIENQNTENVPDITDQLFNNEQNVNLQTENNSQNIQQNEKPVEKVNRIDGQINQLSGENTPQAKQGQGVSERLEENVKQTTSSANPIDEEIAIQEVNLNPTEAQKEAGNYKKGHVKIQGMDVTIENPKGSFRKGIDEDGKAWETELKSHYGYFKRTEGKDGDHIDVFIGENPESNTIFVVDQVFDKGDKSGLFDESKVMLGYLSQKDAEDAYLANYADDFNGMSEVTAVPIDKFKKWLYDRAKQRKPFADYKDFAPDTSVTTKKQKQKSNSITGKAKEIEVSQIDPIDLALKYFVDGGLVTSNDVLKQFKGSNRERLARMSYTSNENGLSIAQIAHNIEESLPESAREGLGAMDVFNAVEDVINSYNSPVSMAKTLLSKYSIDPNQGHSTEWLDQQLSNEEYERLAELELWSNYYKSGQLPTENELIELFNTNENGQEIDSKTSNGIDRSVNPKGNDQIGQNLQGSKSGVQSKNEGEKIVQEKKQFPVKPELKETPEDDIRFKVEQKHNEVAENNNLVVVHNLREEGLLNADNIGGLAMPSLAVIDVNHGFTGYGDITLIADKDLIDPRKNGYSKVFASDVYSARYPSINYQISATGINKLIKKVNSLMPREISSSMNHNLEQEIEDKGLKELKNSRYAKLLFLKDGDNGFNFTMTEQKYPESLRKEFVNSGFSNIETYELTDNPRLKQKLTDLYSSNHEDGSKLKRYLTEDGFLDMNLMRDFLSSVKRDIRESGNINLIETLRNADKFVRENNLEGKFNTYIKDFYNDLGVIEKIFKGFNNSGKRVYLPHTLGNVLKEMKKAGIRAGETSFYGSGSVRAQVTPQFKSIKEIQDKRGNLVENFDALKQEANDGLFEVLDTVKKFYKYDSSHFNYSQNAGEELPQLAKYGRSESFNKIDEESQQIVNDYISKLANMPTEYFEAKINRGVSIAEFKTALIPSDLSQEAKDIFKFNGVKTIEYTDQEDRKEKLKDHSREAGLRFQITGEKEAKNNEGSFSIKSVIDNLQSADKIPRIVHYDTKENIIKYLEENGYSQKTIDNVKNNNFSGVLIRGEIFMDSNNINSPEKAVSVWTHERTHVHTSESLSPQDLIDLYRSVGTREIRRVIPSFYWNRSYQEQADEYISYAAEGFSTTGKLDDQIPEHAKEIITNIVNGFTTPKSLQDAKTGSNSLDNIRQGNAGRNVYGSNSNTGGAGVTDKDSEEKQKAFTRSSLPENEGRAGKGLTISDLAKPDLSKRHNSSNAIAKISNDLSEPINVVHSSEIKNDKIINPKYPKENYDLSEDNLWKFESDLQTAISGKISASSYQVVGGDILLRIKGHTPNWINFAEDLDDNPNIKRVINVTVGDYRNTDSRRNKWSLEDLEQEYSNVEFTDITIDDGEGLFENIDYLSKIINKFKTQTKISNPVFYDNQTLTVISDQIKSVSDLVKSLVHEIAVKNGLREMFAQADSTSSIGRQLAKFDDLNPDLSKLKENSAETDKLSQIIRKAFGLTQSQFSNSDLMGIVNDYPSGAKFKVIEKKLSLGEKPNDMNKRDWDKLPGKNGIRYFDGKIYVTSRPEIFNISDSFNQHENILKHSDQKLFYRATNNKNEHQLSNFKSKNHLTGDLHEGMSVWYSPIYKEKTTGVQESDGTKYIGIVSGDIIGIGADGEPLLDNVNWIYPPSDKLPEKYSRDNIEKKRQLKDEETPWRKLDFSPFSNDVEVIDSPDNLPTKPNTLLINGVSRSTLNSLGKPIANSEEGIRNFWKWFGESATINENGQPIVFYHGTARDFSEFLRSKAKDIEGRRMKVGWGKDKFYFTDSGMSASIAASGAEMFGRGKNQSVMPVYLKMDNPIDSDKYEQLVLDKINDGNDRDKAISIVDKQLKKDGIDGIESEVGGFAVFSPSQIKSSTGNNGNFSPETDDIRFKIEQTIEDLNKIKSLPKSKLSDLLESVNEDVEASMAEAHGIKATPLWERIKAKLTEIKESAQHFQHITESEFPVVYDKLRQFEAIPDRVKKEAYERISEVIRPIVKNKQYFEAFERYIVLQDLVNDIENTELFANKELPWGYNTVDEIKTDMRNVRTYVMRNPAVLKAVRDRKAMMKEVKQSLVDNKLLKDNGNDKYFHHQVLAYMEGQVFPGVSSKDVRNHKKGWQRSRQGSIAAYNTNYLESEFEVLAQSLEQVAIKNILGELGAKINIMPELVKQSKNEGGSWRDYIPEGYKQWFPKQGTNVYKAASIAEKAVQNILNNPDSPDVSQFIAEVEGSMWVIPEQVAKQLDSMKDPEKEMVFPAALRSMTGKWKQWILLNPYSAIKYNFNNISGDLDVVMAYNPAILKPKYAKSATTEAWNNLRGKGMSQDMKEALRYGIITSGISIQEIPDVNQQTLFKAVTRGSENIAQKLWGATAGKYWGSITDLSQLRENVLRLASYKFFKEQIEAGKKPFGASDHKSVEALYKADTDPKEIAGKLARELMGDYGNLSQAGQWLRSHSYPFWSWVEINSPRYYRLLKNTKFEGNTGTLGRVAGAGAAKTAVNIGKLGVKAMLLMGLVVLWNRSMFPDEDDELQKQKDHKLKLIVGRREDGSIMTMKVQGAFSDVLSFFGLEDAVADAEQIKKSKSTVGKKAVEGANAFANKFLQGAMPLTKTLAEVATKKSFYPDVLNPRPIRDRAEQGLRIFKMDKIYNYLTHKPSRPFGKEVSNLLVYDNNPGEAAYFTMRQNIFDFMKDNDEEFPSGESTDRSNALYYYKQSLKLGDPEKAEFWFDKYKELGGTTKGYTASMKKGMIINTIPNDLKAKWFKSLDAEDKEVLEMANKWYLETYLKLGIPKKGTK